MINVNQITSQLAKMPDPMLQKFAAMHKDDPYTVALALSESNRRKELRSAAQAKLAGQAMPKVVDQDIAEMVPPQVQPQMQPQQLPEDVGIGQLPAQNLQKMAGGGIVAFDEGGEVPRFQNRGQVEDPVQKFATEYRPIAEKVGARLGVDPAILIAQWGHETAWGKKTVGNYNFGNIKDVSGKGPSAYDKTEKSRSSYKSYDSPEAFGEDYAALIERNFPKAVGAGRDVNAFSKGLEKGRLGAYGTDENYGKKLAKTFESLIPSAKAEEIDKSYNAIPAAVTKESRNAPAETQQSRSQWQAMGDAAKRIYGAGETGLQYLTGLAAIPTAGGAAVLEQMPNVFSGKGMDRAAMEKSFREKAGQVTFAPRTESGEESSEDLAKFLGGLPPYMAHMGNLSPRKGTPNMVPAVSEMAAAKALKAGLPSAEHPRGIQRLAGPTTDQTMVQGAKNAPEPVKQGRAVMDHAADIEEALAWREAEKKASKGTEGTLPEVLERNAAIERAQNVARVASPAVTAGVDSGAEKAFVPGQGLPAGWGSDLGKEPLPEGSKEGIEKLLETKAPEGKGDKYKDEMALQFFLGLMGGQSPNAFTNVSQAGLGALKYGQEAKDAEIKNKYYEAMAKHYGVDPFVQRLEALKDPENLKTFIKQQEAIGNPALMRELVGEYLKNPAGMSVLKQENPTLYAAVRQAAMSYTAPAPIAGLPGAGAATRPPV